MPLRTLTSILSLALLFFSLAGSVSALTPPGESSSAGSTSSAGGGSSSAGTTGGGDDSKGIPVLEYPTQGGFGFVPVGSGPLGTFTYYFQLIYPWFIGVAAGIAVLWGLFGGIMIIFSADDQAKRAEGIEKFKWAIAGLLMIIFARLILHTLNPNFFL